MKKIEWYALRYDFNSKKLEKYNVLNEYIIDDIKWHIKKEKINTYDNLKEAVRKTFSYYYRYKAEHEIIVSDLFNDDEEKIDIYYQLEPNLDRICEYLIKELKINF